MIDKRMLKDTVTIQKKSGDDQWGKPQYDEPIFLHPVKFDRTYSFRGSQNNRAEDKQSSVLLIYPQFVEVEIDKSILDAKVVDVSDGTEFIVKSLLIQNHPLTKKVLCYELEVV